jgi:hypothetical protein
VGETAGEIRYDIGQTRARMSATIDAIGYRLDLPARMRYRFSHIVHDVSGAITGRPDGGNGGEPGLLAMGEQGVNSMLQAAQGGVAGMVGAVQGGLTSVGQTVQTGLTDIKESVVDTMTSARDTTMAGGTDMTQQMQQQMQEMRDTAMGTWRRIGGFAKDNALALGLGAFAVGIIAGMFIPRSKIEQERIAPLATEIKQKAVDTGEKAMQKGQQMAQQAMSGMTGGQGGMGGQQGQPVHAGQTSGQRYTAERETYREGD